MSKRPTATLCESCQEITLLNLLSDNGHILHPDWESLRDASRACPLCAAIFSEMDSTTKSAYRQGQIDQERFSAASEGRAPQRIEVRELPQSWHEGQETAVCLRIGYRDRDPFAEGHSSDGKPPSEQAVLEARFSGYRAASRFYHFDEIAWLPLFVYAGKYLGLSNLRGQLLMTAADDPLASFQIEKRRPLAPSLADEGTLAMIRSWIHYCQTRHQRCRNAVHKDRIMPGRLIDISKTIETGSLKVIEVDSTFTQPYVTLTYCWGPSAGGESWLSYIRHSQSTKSELLLSQLPLTLQDVVRLCYGLGYSMLWIDALCIIQGSEHDWQIESAKMLHIYEGSALTISASDSQDSKDGCTPMRSQLEREGVVLQLRTEKGDLSNLHVDIERFNLNMVTSQGAVARRAWCLQESRLSNRLLHVCRTQVVFECLECRRYECGGRLDHKFLPSNFYDRLHETLNKPTGYVKTYLNWNGLVADYTRRHLTNSSDKLVAISGLARRAAEVLDSQYLAGIWAQHLELGLSWTSGAHIVVPRDDEDKTLTPGVRVLGRAPSWSWAAVDGPVGWDTYFVGISPTEPTIELLDASISTDSRNVYGQVSGGILTVSGRMKNLSAGSLMANKRLHWTHWASGSAKEIGYYIEDEHKILHGDLCCFQLGLVKHGIGPSMPPTNIILLLKHEQDDMYSRIGAGFIFQSEAFDLCPRQIIRLI